MSCRILIDGKVVATQRAKPGTEVSCGADLEK
jgi:hypothetical protein